MGTQGPDYWYALVPDPQYRLLTFPRTARRLERSGPLLLPKMAGTSQAPPTTAGSMCGILLRPAKTTSKVRSSIASIRPKAALASASTLYASPFRSLSSSANPALVVQWRVYSIRAQEWLHTHLQQRDQPVSAFAARSDRLNPHPQVLPCMQTAGRWRRCAAHCPLRRSDGRASGQLLRPRQLDHESGLELERRVCRQRVCVSLRDLVIGPDSNSQRTRRQGQGVEHRAQGMRRDPDRVR